MRDRVYFLLIWTVINENLDTFNNNLIPLTWTFLFVERLHLLDSSSFFIKAGRQLVIDEKFLAINIPLISQIPFFLLCGRLTNIDLLVPVPIQ